MFADWQGNNYKLILIIVDDLSKIMHYKSDKVTIDALGLAEVIINVVVQYHNPPDPIIIDRGAIFTLKFWFLLCYFLGTKKWLSIAFCFQIDGRTKWENSTMEAYFYTFVNWE